MPEQFEHEMTASQAAAAVRAGDISAVELLEALLARSERLEPRLGVWATLDVDYALDQARSRDEDLRGSRSHRAAAWRACGH